MLAESVLWGFLVLAMARGLYAMMPQAPPAASLQMSQPEQEQPPESQPSTGAAEDRSMAEDLAAPSAWQMTASRLTGAFGAGIYEELLFRLMMLPLIAGCFRLAKQSWAVSFGAATAITSLLFAAAHYRVFTGFGDDLQFYSFTFRFLAGAFFSALFIYRGFGIAVGSHALYDTIVALNSLPAAEN